VSTLLVDSHPADFLGNAKGSQRDKPVDRPPGSAYELPMITITDLEELRRQVAVPHESGRTVAFVPTMGFLHEGHLSLVRRARRLGAFTVVSVFVNPSQFGPGEDLERYPRDLDRDAGLLAGLGVDVLFVPEVRDVYPEGYGTWIEVEDITQGLCGASRPVHFRGVATVVVKLLNMVQPDVAYFGRKDFQQLRVIENAVRDLDMTVSIRGCPTVRDADGIALSSRNEYLSDEERARARTIPSVLAEAALRYAAGTRQAGAILEGLAGRLEGATDSVDYFGLYDPTTLHPIDDGEQVPDGPLLALAVFVGRTRLIDNIQLGIDDPPDV
jgi:pantoate--beta-alanine ligase